MSFNWSGLGTGLGSAFNTLVGAGLTPQNAHNVLTTMMGNSVGSQEKPLLNQIVANYSNPVVVQDLVVKALEVPNLPGDAGAGISQLPALAAAAAQSPAQGLGNFMTVVGAIEKELGL